MTDSSQPSGVGVLALPQSILVTEVPMLCVPERLANDPVRRASECYGVLFYKDLTISPVSLIHS